jgi:integral membrane protein
LSLCPSEPREAATIAPVTFIRALRRLAFVEGISTLVLFLFAMPLKYFAGMPAAVRVVGSAHGVLFVALVIMLLLAIRKVPISPLLAAAGIAAAVVPGGPFVFDRWLAPFDQSPRRTRTMAR